MHKTGGRGLSLRGASMGPKVRVRKKKQAAATKDPKATESPAPAPSAIATIETLIRELRTHLHSIFSTLDPNVPSSILYDNCAMQAFRFFTTTNCITPEGFHLKINKLGLQASRKLCQELFELIDQENLGELSYATFTRRVFLPAGYFNFSKSAPSFSDTSKNDEVRVGTTSASLADSNPGTNRSTRPPPIASPRATTQNSVRKRAPTPIAPPQASNTPSPRRPSPSEAQVALIYENMTFAEIKKHISRKLEERISRTTDRFRQAFRFFTKSEGITFSEFHHHLEHLQIHLTKAKCIEVFEGIDLDKNGTIELAELTETLFHQDESEPHNLIRPGSSRHQNSDRHPQQRLQDFEVEAGSSLSIQEVLARLREKLEQHTSKETDRFRQASKIFSKSTGITPFEFNVAMAKLGLKLTDKQLLDLFELFDVDKSGDLDLNEFVQGVMLDDPSAKHWYTIRDKQKVEESRKKLYSMAVQSVQDSWTIGDIERMLREKIEQRTSRSSDCFRQAFRIFKKVNGIKPDEFHSSLQSIGLTLDRAQADVLFQRFDKNGSGDIDLDEFIHGVLPPDYTGHQWVAAADEFHHQSEQRKKLEAMTRPDRFMTEIEMENWSLDEIEKRLRDKIQQATSKSSDTFRQACKIFKKSSHVTMEDFRESLLALGFRLTREQCIGLFQRYDTNNSDDIDLQEFCMRILPPDYTGEGDHWSHSQNYHRQKEREKIEYAKRSKNGLLTLPKFDDARVRYTRGLHIERNFEDLKESDDYEATHVRSPTRPSTPRRITLLKPNSDTTPVSPQRPHTPRTPRPQGPDLRVVHSATPPTSPRRSLEIQRPLTPRQRPLSPRQPVGSPRNRQVTQRAREAATPRAEEEYEDEEIVEDVGDQECEDEEHLTNHSLRILRAKRTEAAARRHRRKHAAEEVTPSRSSRISDNWDHASVGGESATSFSSTVQRVVGGAKYTPIRSNALLLQRFMRTAVKRKADASGKGSNGISHTKAAASLAARG